MNKANFILLASTFPEVLASLSRRELPLNTVRECPRALDLDKQPFQGSVDKKKKNVSRTFSLRNAAPE